MSLALAALVRSLLGLEEGALPEQESAWLQMLEGKSCGGSSPDFKCRQFSCW